MTKYLFIFLACTFTICNSQNNIFDSISNAKVKTYTSKQFSFNYPTHWEIFDAEDENIIVVSIAPWYDISKMYMAVDSINQDGTLNTATYIGLQVEKDSIRPKHKKYIKKKNIREFSKNQFNISIEKKEGFNLANFMEEREKKIEKSENVNGTIARVTDDHYINELEIFDTFNSNSKITDQVHTMHYYYRNGLLFTLVFSTTPDKTGEYAEASELIFRTFKFN